MTSLPKTPAVWAGIILALLVACGLPIAGISPQVSPEGQGPAITARIGLAGAKGGFRTAAVLPNLHHLTIKLYREGSADPLQTRQVPGTLPADVRFPITHYGRYYITADAFSSTDDSVRLSIQGAVRSSNVAIVESTDTPPSGLPSGGPSGLPSSAPSAMPSSAPSVMPSGMPSAMPSAVASPGAAIPIDWSRVRIRYSSGTSLQVALGLVNPALPSITVAVPSAPPSSYPTMVLTLVDSQDRPRAVYEAVHTGSMVQFVNVPDGRYTVQGYHCNDGYGSLTRQGDTAVTDTGGNVTYDGGGDRVTLRMEPVNDRTNTLIAGINDPTAPTADGGQATATRLRSPDSLAIDNAGRLFISQYDGNIRQVDTNQTITTLAGGNPPNPVPSPLLQLTDLNDGGPAAVARFGSGTLHKLRLGDDGLLYYSDRLLNMIRRLKPDGTLIERVAGGAIVNGNTRGYGGDGGPAMAAQMHFPEAVADAAGRLYICDRGNHRIRLVDTDGTIRTIAGDGTPGVPTWGQPASLCRVSSPNSPALSNGRLYFIADDSICYIDLSSNRMERVIRDDGQYLIGPHDVVGSQLAKGPGGELYLHRYSGPDVYRISTIGNRFIVRRLGLSFASLDDLHVTRSGDLICANSPNGRVLRIR